jgi:polysaccharide biosynthesis/export protein
MGTVKELCLLPTVLLIGALLGGCSFYPAPMPTAVNPPTFPQKLPEKSITPPEMTDLPPPVTENRTFVTVGGVPEYRIGRGDVLEVVVTKGPTQEKYQAQVRANGRIAVSLVDVPVDGLTADQAAEAIAKELSTYFRKPGVDVQVKEFKSKRVSVLGAVGGAANRGGPGNYYLNGRTTLVELISTAGGTPNTAAIDRVRLTRESGKSYTVNVFRVLQQGDLKEDVVIDAGDTVFVPERPPGEETRIFLLGEVKKPGPVPFYANMTMAEVIAGAGGWTDNAQFKEARLIRWSVNEPVIVEVDLQQLILDGNRRIDQVLRPNDVVFIPRTAMADYNAVLNQLMPTLTFITQGLQPVILWQQITK